MISIAFLVNGNKHLGLGHVVRCSAIAKAIKARVECDITFFTANQEIVEGILGNACLIGRVRDITEWCNSSNAEIPALGADIVITDIPHILPQRLAGLPRCCRILASIDDETNIEFCSDLLIRPNLNPHFRHRFAENTKYYCGRDYVILREQFASFQVSGRIIRNQVQQVLVCFGGSDPNRLTERVIRVFKCLGFERVEILVILGEAFRHPEQVEDLLGEGPGRRLIQKVSNMAELFWKCDVALISGGTLMYEACALGTPCIVLSQNSEQSKEATFSAEKGALVSLGEHGAVSDAMIEQTIRMVIADHSLRQELSKRAQLLLDPYGAQRVSELILAELSAAG